MCSFNNAIVNVGTMWIEDTAHFALKLYSTINQVRKVHKAALWLKIPMDFCHYVPIAGHYGFKFHHTKPDHLMMCLWLLEDVPNKVPPFGTHHLGVAGCVVNVEREVLLVKDKHKNAMWKFPGGLADLGEGIGDAAVREVAEETGVASEFQSILSVRHQHDMQFGNGDLYFICRLLPTGGGNLDISKCSHEIEDACWMPLEQFKRETKHSMLAKVADMLDKPEESELKGSVQSQQRAVVT
ncbi:unnamed protein product [Choristocarpus tenellus]